MSNLKLYEIEQEYILLAEKIIDNEGEVDEQTELALQINKENLEAKGRGYGFVIKTAESEIDIIDAEIKRLQSFKNSRVKLASRLKETLGDAMQLFEIEKIEAPTLKISFRKSESIEVDINLLLDEEFLETKISKTANKTKIKEAIKRGETVLGATIVYKNNIQIK